MHFNCFLCRFNTGPHKVTYLTVTFLHVQNCCSSLKVMNGCMIYDIGLDMANYYYYYYLVLTVASTWLSINIIVIIIFFWGVFQNYCFLPCYLFVLYHYSGWKYKLLDMSCFSLIYYDLGGISTLSLTLLGFHPNMLLSLSCEKSRSWNCNWSNWSSKYW